MSSVHKNLSDISSRNLNEAGIYRYGILVSEWNEEVTESLAEGAIQFLKKKGVPSENIIKEYVPGSFELTMGAQWMAEKENIDTVICIGCVIQGETKHFDFICDAVAKGITDINIKYGKPIIFGVLTPNTQQQALDRAGGKHGNKGEEAAATALKMLNLKNSLNSKGV